MVKGCLCICFACLLGIRKIFTTLRHIWDKNLLHTHSDWYNTILKQGNGWLLFFTYMGWGNYIKWQVRKCAMWALLYNSQMNITFLQCNIFKAHSCKYKISNDIQNDKMWILVVVDVNVYCGTLCWNKGLSLYVCYLPEGKRLLFLRCCWHDGI